MGIRKPPLSKRSISELLKDHEMMEKAKLELEKRREIEWDEHKRLTEENKLRIKRMMNLTNQPTSSHNQQNPRHLNPYTFSPSPFTPPGHKPEMWTTGSVNVDDLDKETLPQIKTESEQHTHVVPTGGKKHHIQVNEISHKIIPTRKSIIETVIGFFDNNKRTNTSGPK